MVKQFCPWCVEDFELGYRVTGISAGRQKKKYDHVACCPKCNRLVKKS